MQKREYKEILDYYTLDSKVLVVAVAHEPIDDWSAYIGGVAGKNHEQEFKQVKAEGSKLRYDLAKILFPSFAKKYRWRD